MEWEEGNEREQRKRRRIYQEWEEEMSEWDRQPLEWKRQQKHKAKRKLEEMRIRWYKKLKKLKRQKERKEQIKATEDETPAGGQG